MSNVPLASRHLLIKDQPPTSDSVKLLIISFSMLPTESMSSEDGKTAGCTAAGPPTVTRGEPECENSDGPTVEAGLPVSRNSYVEFSHQFSIEHM
jgi:hypothetical protein